MLPLISSVHFTLGIRFPRHDLWLCKLFEFWVLIPNTVILLLRNHCIRTLFNNTAVYFLLVRDITVVYCFVFQIEKFGTPVAWHVSENISLLLESDELKFASLCVTFSQNDSTLENGIQIMRILSMFLYYMLRFCLKLTVIKLNLYIFVKWFTFIYIFHKNKGYKKITDNYLF